MSERHDLWRNSPAKAPRSGLERCSLGDQSPFTGLINELGNGIPASAFPVDYKLNLFPGEKFSLIIVYSQCERTAILTNYV